MTDQSAETMIPPYARMAVIWAYDPKPCVPAIARLCPDLHTLFIVSEEPVEDSVLGIPCITLRPDDVTRESLAALFARHSTLLCEGRVGCYIEESIQHRLPEHSAILMESLLEATRSAVTQAAFRATKGWHILYGALLNLPRVVDSETIEPLRDGARGLPVLLVGAGPALDTDAPLLAAQRARCIIIACDAAWNSLIRHGVRPDLIMCTDSRDCTWQHLECGSRKQPEVPVAIPVCGSWAVVRHYRGPLCFFRQDWPLDAAIEQVYGSPIPLLNPRKCVGNAAFELAQWMGAERIILTGFNLGFEGERYHPADRSSAEFHEHPHQDCNLRTITGNDGLPMKTDLSMFYYLRDFETQIAHAAVPVWNVTTGGARIAGAHRGTLHQALDGAGSSMRSLPSLKASTFRYAHALYTEFAGTLRRAVEAFEQEARPASLINLENDFLPRHRWVNDLLQTAENPALRAEMRCMHDLWQRDRDLVDLHARAEDAAARWFNAQCSTAALIPALLELRPQERPAEGLWLAVIPDGERQAAAPLLDALQYRRGLRVSFYAGDPNDIAALWAAARTAPGLVMWNGGVLPFVWAFPGLRCINLTTRPPDSNVLLEQWLPGYEIVTTAEYAEAWEKRVPSSVPVFL